MKRTVLLVSILTASASVFADIAVNLKNLTTSVYKADGETRVDQAYVQLIWSTRSETKANINGENLLGDGEYLLNGFVTTEYPYGLFDEGTGYYSDSDVGDANILSGYIFVRIFDNAAIVLGDYYLQQFVQAPTLEPYDAQVPNSLYQTNGEVGGAVSFQGYQIIPEPAVASLVCLFGVGLLVARRMF